MRFPMSRSRSRLARLAVVAGGLAIASLIVAALVAARTDALTPREQALHVLNRLSFGPRPGDVDRVARMGVSAYVEEQLHPERIPDGPVEERLSSGYPTLAMSNAQLIARFEEPLRAARKKLKAERANMEPGPTAADAGEADPPAGDLQKLRDLIPPDQRPRRILDELTAARILRATESERQLNEVMVDFWMNHFNVYANKGQDRFAIVSFERDTIRPHIWGTFEELLQATAKSPAMLFYLDNARSVADAENRPAVPAARAARVANPNAPRGLNENYARELMELHTLGVDGGYTQRDVTELARILTGWSIGLPRREGAQAAAGGRGFGRGRGAMMRSAETPGEFVFRAAAHDAGTKTLLGVPFAPNGIAEGERAIAMLAHHPATAHHIAYQLCQRIVADEPPKELVDRIARRFLANGGDLRDTVRAIVTSPEFFDPQYYRSKIKSPFEYVVSALRAVGGATDGRAIASKIAEMGEPLYLCQPPTGYSDTADAWVSSGALLARLNFALALAQGRLAGTTADPGIVKLAGASPGRGVDSAAHWLIGTDISEGTLATITQRVAEDGSGETLVAGLLLGSPEFQKQ
ncbi:MAG TPA: DUF1800 domain-containing protein [Thermoanaerobaculia bacterium]